MGKTRMGSILASVTISSLALTLAAQTTVAGDQAAEFMREIFGGEVPHSKLSVTGEVARVVRATLGSGASRQVKCYHSVSNGTVWVLSAQGRHGPITAAFAVYGSRIRNCRILEDRERRGRRIRGRRYLQQFVGLRLVDGNRFDRRVDGITGATVSSRAVEKMALLALRLNETTCRAGTNQITEDVVVFSAEAVLKTTLEPP